MPGTESTGLLVTVTVPHNAVVAVADLVMVHTVLLPHYTAQHDTASGYYIICYDACPGGAGSPSTLGARVWRRRWFFASSTAAVAPALRGSAEGRHCEHCALVQ